MIDHTILANDEGWMCSDIYKSVYDVHNIIYLQGIIKDINSDPFIYSNENAQLMLQEEEICLFSPSSHNTLYQVNNYPQQLDNGRSSISFRYAYPLSDIIGNPLLCYSDATGIKVPEETAKCISNPCYFCETSNLKYLGNDISIPNANEIEFSLVVNEDNSNTCGIIVETNLEINQWDFDIVLTISEIPNPADFICESCAKMFKSASALKCHLRIHNSERPFKCHLCSMSFKQSSHLISHIRRHTGERPFECPFCDDSFVQRTPLKKHIEAIHKTVKSYKLDQKKYEIKNFYCSFCKKTFLGVSKKEHNKIHAKAEFQCSVCSKNFKRLESFLNHIRIHDAMSQYSVQKILEPRRKYNKIHKFACKFCNKIFNNRGNLAVHNRIHTGQRPYQCDVCLADFKQISHLKDHFRRHSACTYVCSVCDMRYLRHSSAVKHVLSRHFSREAFIVKILDKIVKEDEEV